MEIKKLTCLGIFILIIMLQVGSSQRNVTLEELQSKLIAVAPLFVRQFLEKGLVIVMLGVVLLVVFTYNSLSHIGIQPSILLNILCLLLGKSILLGRDLLEVEKKGIEEGKVLVEMAEGLTSNNSIC